MFFLKGLVHIRVLKESSLGLTACGMVMLLSLLMRLHWAPRSKNLQVAMKTKPTYTKLPIFPFHLTEHSLPPPTATGISNSGHWQLENVLLSFQSILMLSLEYPFLRKATFSHLQGMTSSFMYGRSMTFCHSI